MAVLLKKIPMLPVMIQRKKILKREVKKEEKRSPFSNILIVQKKLVQALLAIAGNDLTSLIETRN